MAKRPFNGGPIFGWPKKLDTSRPTDRAHSPTSPSRAADRRPTPWVRLFATLGRQTIRIVIADLPLRTSVFAAGVFLKHAPIIDAQLTDDAFIDNRAFVTLALTGEWVTPSFRRTIWGIAKTSIYMTLVTGTAE